MNPNSSSDNGASAREAVHRINQSMRPEWLRVPDAVRTFGFSRSMLYDLIAENKIRSTSVKKRGALRGIRLISYDSLQAYVESSFSDSTAVA